MRTASAAQGGYSTNLSILHTSYFPANLIFSESIDHPISCRKFSFTSQPSVAGSSGLHLSFLPVQNAPHCVQKTGAVHNNLRLSETKEEKEEDCSLIPGTAEITHSHKNNEILMIIVFRPQSIAMPGIAETFCPNQLFRLFQWSRIMQ